jgi:uncharacterized membrane protein
MATPKQARTAGTRPGGGKTRDKGTRGGRPEPTPAAAGAQREGGRPRQGNGQTRGNGQTPQASRPVGRQAAVAAPAGPLAVPLWYQLTTWLLAFAGLGVSVYLTVAHFTSSSILACSDKGLVNCAAVTTSPESEVFGIFPVAVLGLAFYVFMFAATSPWAWRVTWPPLRWIRFGSVAVGMAFVLYLIYTELFTLNAICLWCTSVHVITFLLFGLIVFGLAAGYGAPEAASRR